MFRLNGGLSGVKSLEKIDAMTSDELRAVLDVNRFGGAGTARRVLDGETEW